MVRAARWASVALVFMADLDDIQRETVLEFHAGGTEDGSQRARGASLLADDLADIVAGDMQTENDSVLLAENLHSNGVRIVNQSTGDLSHQSLHLRDS